MDCIRRTINEVVAAEVKKCFKKRVTTLDFLKNIFLKSCKFVSFFILVSMGALEFPGFTTNPLQNLSYILPIMWHSEKPGITI